MVSAAAVDRLSALHKQAHVDDEAVSSTTSEPKLGPSSCNLVLALDEVWTRTSFEALEGLRTKVGDHYEQAMPGPAAYVGKVPEPPQHDAAGQLTRDDIIGVSSCSGDS